MESIVRSGAQSLMHHLSFAKPNLLTLAAQLPYGEEEPRERMDSTDSVIPDGIMVNLLSDNLKYSLKPAETLLKRVGASAECKFGIWPEQGGVLVLTNNRLRLLQARPSSSLGIMAQEESPGFMMKYFSVSLHLINRLERKSSNNERGRCIRLELWTKDLRNMTIAFYSESDLEET